MSPLQAAVEEPATGAAALNAELELIEAAERSKARLDAATLPALARMLATAEAELAGMRRARPRARAAFTARELVVLEVTTATGLGPREVGLRLDLATGPAARTGYLLDRLTAGATTLSRACEVLEATTGLADEDVDTVARSALAPTRDGAGLSVTLFRQRLRRAVLAIDTQAAAARRRAGRARIGAYARLHEDGTGTLVVTNDADKITAAMDRADAAARAARAGGDPRTLERLRADYLSDTTIWGQPGPEGCLPALGRRPPGTVWVVVPITTALGLDDSPCELPGHGWVSAQQARAIMTAEGSIWKTLLADADTGRALQLHRTGYRPTAAMIEHVHAVDGTCRGPGCQVPAARCDLDHDTPWPAGPTRPDNLSAKHRTHHRVKTEGIWHTHRDPLTGTIQWRTATGRRYLTHPKDWLEAARQAPPRPHPPDPDPDPPPAEAPPTDPQPEDPPPF